MSLEYTPRRSIILLLQWFRERSWTQAQHFKSGDRGTKNELVRYMIIAQL